MKKEIRKLIKEYIGTEYYFLENFIDGGYEPYIEKNIDKITTKLVYGVRVKRKEYRNIFSPELIKQKIIDNCEQTIYYVKESLEFKK